MEELFTERVEGIRNPDPNPAAAIAGIHPEYTAVLPEGSVMTYDDITAYIARGRQQFVEVTD
jgi:hypothetical protein